ncbi:ABC transporter permease [Thermochromatium tepidum]|jgi:ABC-type multidrug transport system, permease component|uniref:Transport permease protein n=1 Tax=Thermochromatium tepidum ATCC 43061 TaxID=316276 RepID=A0A6I6E2V7_THETI|nr:ABC transporter permease [Thermochromatium tepidum]QGU32062.1 ABC transporter permease [Thermochromatium tepidum ATCC 43061]
MWRRILAILVARNREFYRDRAGLGWNLLMPLLMVLAFAFIFPDQQTALLKIGVLTPDDTLSGVESPMLDLKAVTFVTVSSAEQASAIVKVERHQLDLLFDPNPGAPHYWVNSDSARGALAERLLLTAGCAPAGSATGAGPQASNPPQRQALSGAALRYVDWVLPGVLAMNVLFSSLWGVGWVIVRYRKNGVLRRLRATPLSAWEFLTAQVLSRLLVVLGANAIVYLAVEWLLEVPMRGSAVTLALVYVAGALCLISLGLIVAARLRSEELADGLLNLLSWPMLLLSGVWFSLEGTSPWAQWVAQASPLTHLVAAARAVMLDGAGLVEVLPEIGVLLALAAAFLALATWMFRWE